MTIPLIGVAPAATEYECAFCRKSFTGIDKMKVTTNGANIVCLGCHCILAAAGIMQLRHL